MSSLNRRPLLPRPPSRDSGLASSVGGPSSPPHRKREIVRVACQPCRTRKAKCDARRPRCTPCINKDRTCEYDTEADVGRYTSLKRKHGRLETEHDGLLELFEMLKFRPPRDARAILDRVRSTDDLQATLAFIKQGDLLMQRQATGAPSGTGLMPRAIPPTESLLNMFHPLAYPALAPLNEPEAGLGLKRKSAIEVSPDEHELSQEDIDSAKDVSKEHCLRDDRLFKVRASRWTSVIDSDTIVANLLSLYLSWEHATVRIFDENYFVEQLISGEEDYCSSLLVNAILLVATLNYKALDPFTMFDLSPRLYKEVQRLWKEEEAKGGLMVVPASILLDVWWKTNGDAAKGAEYLGRGIEIATKLGLFEDECRHDREETSRLERKGKAIIAWGIFNWQALDALIASRDGYLRQPPETSIPSDPITKSEDVTDWDSFPMLRPLQHIDRHETFQSVCQFSVVLNEHISVRSKMAAADTNDSYSGDIKAMFAKLIGWADKLPSTMTRAEDCLPVVLDMHMLFHATVIDVFAPILRSASNAGALARDITSASLAQLRRILYVQRYRYGGPPLTSAVVHAVHVLAKDLVERLIRAKNTDGESEFYIILAIDTLMQISTCYPVTRGILRGLVDRVNSADARERLPPEVVNMFRGVEEAFFIKPEKSQPRAQDMYAVDLEMAVTDPSEIVMDWLESAAGEMKLT